MAYSDNRHSNIGLIALIGVFSMVVGFILAGLLPERRLSPAVNREAPQTVSSHDQTQAPFQETRQTEIEDRTPQITDISSPEFNNSTGTYSIVVHASVPSRDPLNYLIKDKQSVLYENSNGVFSGITPSSDGGRYFVEVVNAAYPEISSGLRTASGFDVKIEAVPKTTKVSAGELSGKFNTGSYSSSFSGAWEREHLAQRCRFVFSGIKDDEPRPGDIGAICSRIQMGTWSSVEVTNVSYDTENRITSISMIVNYPEE